MIRAITCDLDGTLLDHEARIRPKSAQALVELSRQGVMVILASGRSWRTVLRIQRALGLVGPIITHNGAYGYDSAQQREWYRHGVPASRARQFVSWADEVQVMVRCYLGAHQPVVYNRFDLAHQLCWMRPEDRLIPNLADSLSTDPLEIFLSGLDAVDQFIARFGMRGDDYELTVFPHVGYREVNICAPRVDKVEALEELCRLWDINPRDVLALGDGANDVRMLAWAGRAVAIGDGNPLAQAEADFVTSRGNPEPVLEGLLWALPRYLSLPLSSA
ncbi:HAD family hydrolase [Sulfobacillus harzensis]|uniref:HAD family phosphatase n=1 Tax=Sulfobacillus harzensis TaxID=2729629 RepID=A0A7Y0L1R4_9FIRM|nr:HAD family hydrolase [Sulfobacillus harzensis]NMP21478.1 HAD family phosphatase [Sulfobacillus harzensis]